MFVLKRWIRVLFLAVMVVLLATGCQQAPKSEAQETASQTAPAPASPESSAAQETSSERSGSPEERQERQRQQRLVERWWNQDEVIAFADLSEDQRSQLDEFFGATLEAQTKAQAEQMEGFQHFAVALENGDWETADAQIEAMVVAMGAQARARAELMRSGIALLSDEQRAKLAGEYPLIFQRSWLGSPNRLQGRAAGNTGTRARRRLQEKEDE